VRELDKALWSVRGRDWDIIRSNWLNHIPFFSQGGQTPTAAVADVQGVGSILDDLARARAARYATVTEAVRKEFCKRSAKPKADLAAITSEIRKFETRKTNEVFAGVKPREESVPELRETVLLEAIFLAHKAAHVLGTAQMNVYLGIRTWSLCDAYQSALFAAKSLSSICGVAIAEVASRTLLIDLFPTAADGGTTDAESAFSLVGTRLDHASVWEITQRVLRITTCKVWPREAVTKLATVDKQNFAKQRNHVEYDNRGWIEDDLHRFVTSGPFGSILHWNTSNLDIDFSRKDISLVIGYYLLRLVLLLLMDLETKTGKITPELDVLRSTIKTLRHPLYNASLLVPL
jgi:hypothetical protein